MNTMGRLQALWVDYKHYGRLISFSLSLYAPFFEEEYFKYSTACLGEDGFLE
jgi:hypothetical protein